jgi:hypothetical protein
LDRLVMFIAGIGRRLGVGLRLRTADADLY